MNTTLRKLSLATALVLGVALTGAAHAASHATPSHVAGQGKVAYPGTIKVTREDAESRKASRYGSTAYLGRVKVTAADSEQAHDAARYAARSGAVYLGAVQVTANDSEDARYAERLAAAPGTAYLGSVRVTPAKGSATLFASAARVGRLTLAKLASALAFVRVGG